MPPTISSPLRLLLLSTPDTPYPTCLKDTSHHEIRTQYYKASIPIWRDDAPFTTPTISSWKEEWSNAEAGEVIQAVGAWVVCFKKPRVKHDLDLIRSLLTTVHKVIEHHTRSSYSISEPLLLAVGMQQGLSPSLEMESEEWEEFCGECGGWEWIEGEVGRGEEGTKEVGRNEFGEKIGIPRLLEALEANEWDSGDGEVDGDLTEDELGLEDGFGAEAAQMEREMMGLKMAVHGEECVGAGDGEGGDEDVQDMENMILKMQAIKDMGADMPEAERRKFAAKAVRDIVKTL
ncbi:hypothetical protein N7G274_000028 [Stereocaulon virgatum]|uniref:Uncharacterized protein n=1 Tax=Stereocaulon virgatum TaxID=373712 RepID=A0ABR4AQW8_9LECA